MLFLTVSRTFRSSPVATAHFMMTRDWIGRWCLNLRKQLQTFVKRFVFCGFFVVWCCMSSFLCSNNIVSGLSCQSKLQQCVRLGPDPGSCSRRGAVCGERRLFRSGLLWLATARPHHWTGKGVWSMTTFTCAQCLYYKCFKCNLFLWCKAEFSASLLQSSVSHDHPEINLIWWFADKIFSNIISGFAVTFDKFNVSYFWNWTSLWA